MTCEKNILKLLSLFENHTSPGSGGARKLFTAMLSVLMLLPGASQAADTICVKVKIEIVQELNCGTHWVVCTVLG